MKTKYKISALLMALTLLLVGCSGGSGDKDKTDPNAKGFKNIMFVVTGSLGGGTNNDDVYETLTAYAKTVDGKVDTFEANMDTSLFESTLMKASESGQYDLIVTGFGTMIEALSNTAKAYPDQKYFIFDTEMDYKDGKNSNVISAQALQNQGGFLAGVMAALVTTSDAEFANDQKKVGFVGAIESTSIQDFLVSYIEGVKYIDPSVEVIYSFVGNHKDTALAKEIALTQYQQGADVIFAVGGNGLGVAEASKDANRYVIGVDFDYSERVEEDTKNHVLTSVIKDYKKMVNPILEGINNDTIKWGTHEYISYDKGGVYLVNNEYTKKALSKEVLDKYSEVEEKIKNNEIEVSTAFGATKEEIDAILNKSKATN
ncbi:BMP family ABC transporter substrate-binding protein [uncultured Helcococcus sp.]|uniref:BMP family lipoprotein n=1 Tax=uncultured Helcococcus sp. TaxID=1072508 RepID=UPI00288B77E7|nr:BMP family ABC transporter substrate-binding protein [uncultured Helcococcus sp.]